MVIKLTRQLLVVVAIVLILVAVLIARSSDDSTTSAWEVSAPVPQTVQHSTGGEVRVGVLSPPEIGDQGVGGATVRALVLPQNFIAQPDGTWRASLVQPGTDRGSEDNLSASFALRPNARWSNGAPITVEDLRNSADEQWVESVSDADAEGRITVRFKRALPDWRRLWSNGATVTAPAADVYGGPFVIDSVVSGLQTDLVRNPNWYATEGGPFLDQLSLVVAADNTLGRQLLTTDQIDVYSPQADSARSEQLRNISGVELSRETRTGSWTALRFSERTSQEVRLRLAASIPRDRFVNGLLESEATVIAGFAPNSSTWRAGVLGTGTGGRSVELLTPTNTALMDLFRRSTATAFDTANSSTNQSPLSKAALDARVVSGDYDVAFIERQEGPAFCWSCSFASVDSELSYRADSGDVEAAKLLEEKLRNEGYLLPLWRANAVTAWRSNAVEGVTANGYSVSAAWNAQYWFSE